MKNMAELRDELIKNHKLVISNQRPSKIGQVVVNNAGKIIQTINSDFKYQNMMGTKKPIKFMESGK